MTRRRWKIRAIAIAAISTFGLAAPANSAGPDGFHPGPLSRAEAFARAKALTALGQKMFFDPSLSASGKQACSSCHDPSHAFGPASATPVEMGGPNLDQPGVRAVPSLRYLQAAPAFTEHFHDSEDEGDESVDNGPTGGLTWDGRADHGKDQAKIPLLSPFEMANKGAGAVTAALRKSAYAGEFKTVFGQDVFNHPNDAFDAAAEALGTFEQSAADFYPYSSRYDAFLAGKATLSTQELHGRALFEDEKKGNCASCHLSEPANDGEPPQFTDFGLIAIAVPRNPAIPANADPAYADLGLCGPLRTDFHGRTDYCGLFKTPTLRNVALRRSFFHNGELHTLRDAVAFYASRDTDPGRWYPKNADGTVRKYDDLPKAYWPNLNQDPFGGRRPGGKPALTDAEIDDIVAFLQTLTDADQVAAK
ncbi:MULTISPECIES: cytochrome-c peroxidase [unclassified Mesorhizobium]|uniref:cytochrome-c peroxidase n=1 Tax=unclassified Mesorhizobium TaxID=325217 RepID=UPI000FDB5B54|nr:MULTISPECIES: cytochrome-c peroxidase [unclassified Mesorhizobium]TGR47128.1 c-type cytochrome [bacterium M00.F.Ca.ET.199.01.1.1]TGU36580.1 c-type cytochrome [bacterium M00.F.Ca.ET.156.01.1.1]TGV87770.1 c-type cytochrome [Mesorhizobium sp. M00.F.Ca.ET.149.01.1.1]TGR28843.1 c-type cytochrome [Mesorhizobium sp. M8A.F.Ca.ET.202.01.1.1]TGR29932.1 c-type cytochrome [Mesorhizobium sp. M8A.F.Ca.ET.197.01.1.1]